MELFENKYTYKQLAEKFLLFEKDKNILSLNFKGVYGWEISRTIIFFLIVDNYLPSNTHLGKIDVWKYIKNVIYRISVNSIFFNPFLSFKKSQVLIFESGRKYNNDGKSIDIYTEYLDEDFERKNIPFTRYEMSYIADDDFANRKFKTKHVDFLLLTAKFLKRVNTVSFNQIEMESANAIRHNIIAEFGVDLDIESIFKSEIGRFKAEFSLYSMLFKIKKPKEIYLVNSCDKSGLIAAAQNQSILVNELQHGLNSNFDVVLNFPYNSQGDLHYFPDRFFKWNNVDMFFAHLPLCVENIKHFKNNHIENWLEKTASLTKEKSTILVISQPYGSQQILDFVLANISNMKEYNFIYKIHPAENIDKFSEVLNENPEFNNLRFLMNEESIYKLMKKAQYVVGIYSSSLFEAPLFGCRVILLNLPGVEMSYSLLASEQNSMINVSDSFSDCLLLNDV